MESLESLDTTFPECALLIIAAGLMLTLSCSSTRSISDSVSFWCYLSDTRKGEARILPSLRFSAAAQWYLLTFVTFLGCIWWQTTFTPLEHGGEMSTHGAMVSHLLWVAYLVGSPGLAIQEVRPGPGQEEEGSCRCGLCIPLHYMYLYTYEYVIMCIYIYTHRCMYSTHIYIHD